MFVISQDEKKITDNIEFLVTDNKAKFVGADGTIVETIPATEFYIKSPYWIFGTYSTFERAKEVFEDIQWNCLINHQDYILPKE